MADLSFVLQLAGPVTVDFTAIYPSMVCRYLDSGVRVIVQILDANRQPAVIRDATRLRIKLMKPDGTVYDAVPAFLTNGYDGKIYFTSSNTVPPFNEAGTWFIQAEVTIGSVQLSTEWGSFAVEGNIDNN